MTQDIDPLLALMVWLRDHHLPFRFCVERTGTPYSSSSGIYCEYVVIRGDQEVYSVFSEPGVYKIIEWEKHKFDADSTYNVDYKDIHYIELANPECFMELANLTLPTSSKRHLK